MKREKEDVPIQYFERNAALVAFFSLLTLFFGFLTVKYYREFNPLTFICGVPAVVFFFQALWLMLNPFAIIYEDKFEMKKTIFSNKNWYFIDIKSVSEVTSGGFDIIYNDDEVEHISTFGIRASHKKNFRDAVNHYVCRSLVEERDD